VSSGPFAGQEREKREELDGSLDEKREERRSFAPRRAGDANR
jgi:hypothetical protein